MENSNLKEDESQSPSMASSTTQDSEITEETGTSRTNQETTTYVSFFQMNYSDEHEHEAQSPKVEQTDLRLKDRKKEKESIFKAKKDEIFTWKDAENTTHRPPELKSESRSRKIGIRIREEPASPKTKPSNKEAPLTFSKRRRKQERPRRAPRGDETDQISEADDGAKPPTEDNQTKKKKKE